MMQVFTDFAVQIRIILLLHSEIDYLEELSSLQGADLILIRETMQLLSVMFNNPPYDMLQQFSYEKHDFLRAITRLSNFNHPQCMEIVEQANSIKDIHSEWMDSQEEEYEEAQSQILHKTQITL